MREEDLSNISGGETDCDLPPASETPRTDAAKAKFAKCMYTRACVCVDAEDMADLERELAALRAPLPDVESQVYLATDPRGMKYGLIEVVPADLARAQGQRLAEAENECAVRNDEVTGLTGQLAEAETLIDTLRMQAAACMTATFQNTHASKKNRIDCCHPYWTQAYDDVCAAVDREITERERAEAAEKRSQQNLSEVCAVVEKNEALLSQLAIKHHALENLFALVNGECPGLLRDDHHYEMVMNALAAAPSAAPAQNGVESVPVPDHTLILYNDDGSIKHTIRVSPEPRGCPIPGTCACPETEVEPSQPLPQSRTTT